MIFVCVNLIASFKKFGFFINTTKQLCLNSYMSKIIVTYADICFEQAARNMSDLIGLPLEYITPNKQSVSPEADYCLSFTDQGLVFMPLANNHGAIRCDFVSGSHRHRRNHGGGNGQMIAKAIGVSGKFYPKVLDLTAGLGSDGFVLASLGCSLQLLERNLVVFQLLKDGLDRAVIAAAEDIELAQIMSRISFSHTNSLDYLKKLSEHEYPDVIYIDPMFPPRKKSAQVKKEMQALHQIVGADDDAAQILEHALDKAVYRIVVKRPAHSDFLGKQRPSYSLEGKSTRYDIFAKQKLPK